MTADKPGFSISSISIRRHIGTIMLTLAIVVVGIFYITQLPVDLLPSITYPRISVRLDAPGVSPEVAVDEITRPLEQGLSATEGVTQVFSRTREGQVSVDLFFKPGGDINQALNDATASVNRIRNRLPDTVASPTLFKFDPSQQPVYEFALTSDSRQGVDLRVFADDELAREINVIPGVASVDVSGGVQEEIQVNIDLNRLQSLGVNLNDVFSALRDRNLDTSGGRLRQESNEPLTRTIGRFKTAAEINNLSFQISGSNPPKRVYLRDFAKVNDGTEEQRVKVFLNQKPAVKISILKQPDANTITVVDGVKNRLKEMQKAGLISADMKVVTTLDESRFIRNSLADVANAGISGAVLAAIAVLFFLGSLRQTLIISLTIPLCTLAAIILMRLFGLSLNLFSLGGLALGIGQAIDTSVVILENIVVGLNSNPDLKKGKIKNRKELTIEESVMRSQEVESAMVASTAANLVSVLPFLLIGGFFSLLFSELILTICFAVAASLLVAVTVVPMLTSRLMGMSYSSGVSQFGPIKHFNRGFENGTRAYGAVLSKVLGLRLIIIPLAFIILGCGTWVMASQIPQEILPRINTSQARLFALFPPGTNLETNQKVVAAADKLLLAQPETEYTLTTAGGLLFGNNTIENLLRGSSTITLKKGTNTIAFTERMTEELRKIDVPKGTRLRLVPEGIRGLVLTNSPVRGGEIDVILQGPTEKSLQEAGRKILKELDEKVKLARFRPDGDAPQSEVQIRPDWERASLYGLSARDIGETVQTAIEGSVPTQVQRGNRLVDVRVQFDRTSVKSIAQLGQIPLSGNNSIVRLSDVAKIAIGQAPGEIQRLNQRQVFLVVGNLNRGASLGDAVKQVDAVLSEIKLPPGVTIVPSSAAETNQQLQTSLKLLGGLATFLVFVAMAVQYNSLVDPLVILLTVPLALAGGVFGLYVTKTAIGATVMIGAILLVGIIVNNGIIMVELANQIREDEKVDRATAIVRAAPQRLRPILMTTITTVLGLFPLALGIGEGSEFLQPLGVVVFSGLSLATLLTLFIIPCFYILLHDFFGMFGAKKKPQAVAVPVQKAGGKTTN
ncbi:MAG: efflux RND transporter permease subunit [Microcoleus sp. PH2017_01_SCD_O_A]|uniref:efflux RND transporter permease subunit n=1 Tax=unclassified Microcoleus TaxID=2642155 RepID=UPI001D73D31B|nr:MULTISPECIES: efflux RND transporter permease subunit [unclassified Microcoleus]MCC3416518.1 efflux RND transporter permease subunit [Microcoleus sp. PH2017_07_MST_O_A]MCC3509601.1 efflux RND transporter permease subunit [Microcoleus sp. PH2017_17_BER_D_A]TAG12821.1 MAG: AcrB/AcrD/AcrF family protein [Oscillatoriales cyanobacterium]MCC3424423.1 efflux RND transporter permease subunit [Microcoleus sp. PH2017_01_SCD_O_A]MCC3436775.1 efflux RND transporter permease subunit [Microcoleus sp. PH2